MAKTYYKLTNQFNTTHYSTHITQWGEGITHKAVGKGSELCSEDVIHVYDHPLKAVLFNPIHASFSNPKLWKCKVRKVVADDSLKVGVKECTTIKEIPLPKITTEQRVKFAIYCALEIYNEPSFVKWAKNWLSGQDRTSESAYAAARVADAAYAIAYAAYTTRVAYAAATHVADYAAYAAAHAAYAVDASYVAEYAAYAAEYAARVAYAARAELTVCREIKFVKLIKKAMK